MLPVPDRLTVATHWGTYLVRMDEGRPVALEGHDGDPDPSPIARSMIGAQSDSSRILRPMVRQSFLERGAAATGAGRGREPFVEIDWPQALDLVAGELDRVRTGFGNASIYGGSYGWASAGRFHHAQSQIHRFLNMIGGYTRSVQNYSYAAGDAILPHVIGDKRGLGVGHTPWSLIKGNAELIVLFGGVSAKNAQVNPGGVGRHSVGENLMACREAGADLVSISPIRDDTAESHGAEWMPVRPNTDVALMLALAHTLIVGSLYDEDFLDRYTTGFDRFRDYVLGGPDGIEKTPEWAAAITDLPAGSIRGLARRMAERRTFIMMSWSLQRAEHGEQPYWMAITLAAMLGQIGLPGGGFGFGYGSTNGIGTALHKLAWPSFPQGANPVSSFIPVARVADMLLNPGDQFDFNGERHAYPDIRLVYWAGGNPFHHHQDLNRLVRAWRNPETVIVHEAWWNGSARHADIVLPVTTQLERNDIVCSSSDRLLAASHRVLEPAGASRDDYWIFSEVARRLMVEERFTEGLDEEAWVRRLYAEARRRIEGLGLPMPDFDEFWRTGVVMLPDPERPACLLEEFRADPIGHPLATPSGRIEIYSERIAGFGYEDCPGHPQWLEPAEWLGSRKARQYGLHLISSQPATKLHSQYDNGSYSRTTRPKQREPVRINPADAAARNIADGDIVRVYNDRGACLAEARVSSALRQGVIQLATGAWYDPANPGADGSLEKHGNPNVLTQDKGTSRLGQGTSAHTCLVEIERYDAMPPEVTAYVPPVILRMTKRTL